MRSAEMNILVIDDDADDLRAIATLATLDGVRLHTATTAAQALALLQAHPPGLVLLATLPPGMDAAALVARLRSAQPDAPPPIVHISAAAPDGHAPGADLPPGDPSDGVVDVLVRPIVPWLLRSKVQVFLALHQQRSQLATRLAELERLARLNALMIGALSHDIRTPLAALSLNAELVSRRAESAPLQQAGARLKAATSMLSRQVDHLVNLASQPAHDIVPQLQDADLATLVAACLATLAARDGADAPATPALQQQGDTSVRLDPTLLAEAVDRLLLLAASHGGEQALQVEVDGSARRAVVLRLRLAEPVSDTAQAWLFGSDRAVPGLPAARVGPGLDAAERIVRAHGGSLIGRSSKREGTLFELMLPKE